MLFSSCRVRVGQRKAEAYHHMQTILKSRWKLSRTLRRLLFQSLFAWQLWLGKLTKHCFFIDRNFIDFLCFFSRYILLGASLFEAWEKWNYLDGSYFCFISLSSIGFGDLVPGVAVSTLYFYKNSFGFTMQFNSFNNSFHKHNKILLIKMCDNKLFISCMIVWCGPHTRE